MKALDTVKKPVGKHSENFKGLYINSFNHDINIIRWYD